LQLENYVAITPARNEAQFIELTLRSMIKQTIKPIKWVIVSDGSTDGTDDIVRKYASDHPWIELIRMPERAERDFAGKVFAFKAGYERIKNLSYQAIASLDGDLSFDSHYFAFLMAKLSGDQNLGLVGTPFRDSGSGVTYDYRFVNIDHVSGACQFFRRECFESIGGYAPVKGGGIDYIAVISSRMKGWKTRTFTEKYTLHHRPMGTAQHGTLRARFKYGLKDYALGNSVLWELFRSLYQITQRPFLLGGLMIFCGFCWAMMRNSPRPISDEMVAFGRREQKQRLGRFFRKCVGIAPSAPPQQDLVPVSKPQVS
jgi:poly-beta-1,6-N-acetyl-D-glucosamine synthase